MNSREVASLALKLLGVYAILEALPLLQYLGAFSVMPSDYRGNTVREVCAFLAMVVPLLLVAVAAFLLLTQSEAIARLLVKEQQTLPSAGSLSSREIQALAFSVVGALVFVRGLPGVCQLVIEIWYLGPVYFSDQRRAAFMRVIPTLGPVIQCVLGVVLFFRSRGLANFWHRLQTARYVKIDTAVPPTPTEQKNA